MTQRVAITGMGAISAAGHGVQALWEAARDGKSGIARFEMARAEPLRIRIAASVPDFDPTTFISPEVMRTTDRVSHLAMYAAQAAVADAGLDPGLVACDRTAVIMGTGVGGIGTLDEGCYRFYHGEKMEMFSVPRVMTSSAACHVSIAHGITGPVFAVSSACASGSQAIGMAAMLIRAGVIDRALAGGTEACITPGTMKAWEMLRVLTPDFCRPFSLGRSGMTIGEGAGMFLLEAEDAALARGAVPHAWLTGYGTSSDAHDMLQPNADGAARAMTAALAEAGVSDEDIGYINAHGTGTVLNDITEAAALRQVFGDAIDAIPVSSSKPIIGHTLGAGGALELIITIRALQEQMIPPNINFLGADPKCPLNLPVGAAQPASFRAALSNSFAFGGINAALVVERAGA